MNSSRVADTRTMSREDHPSRYDMARGYHRGSTSRKSEGLHFAFRPSTNPCSKPRLYQMYWWRSRWPSHRVHRYFCLHGFSSGLATTNSCGLSHAASLRWFAFTCSIHSRMSFLSTAHPPGRSMSMSLSSSSRANSKSLSSYSASSPSLPWYVTRLSLLTGKSSRCTALIAFCMFPA